jgi:probable H4MPT-linked C1 transfer pathway protein
MNGSRVLGWDIGGANIKAALIDDAHRLSPQVIERPFPLWREPNGLAAILGDIAEALGGPASAMAVTMTAELADCFQTKREGVSFVLDAYRTAFPGSRTCVYGVDGRFRSIDEAVEDPLQVAAANWRASAGLVARTWPDALFVDVGSTTTDLIPIVGGRVAAKGHTDPARLRTGELVYTGALRTPVSAILGSVTIRGARYRVAAELFAIAADAYVWLERITPRDYTCETPDGRGCTRPEAAARLARMICADLDMLTADDVTEIAGGVARAQTARIAAGIRQVLRGLGPARPRLAVLAGQGAFLAREAVQTQSLEPLDLATELGAAAAQAAPAAAVALLLAESLEFN